MPWSNAWSGGGAVVASSVQVINGNAVVASITPQGNITGQIISANTDLILAGTSVTTLLNNQPKGMIAQTNIAAANLPSPTVAVGAAEVTIMELDMILSPQRMYQIFLSNMEVSTSGSPCRPIARVRYTSDGTTPTIASPRLFETWADLGTVLAASDFAIPVGQSRVTVIATQVNLRLLMTSQNQIVTAGGVQQTHQFIGLDTGPQLKVGPMLAINDLGPTVPDTGVYLNGGGGSATPVFRSFQVAALDSQSFQQSGPASAGSGSSNESFMYFGPDPSFAPNGIWRSYAWFSISSTAGGNGLGSLTGMVGVTAANISYLDVFVYADWFWAIAGGTLWIGHANTAINHSSENQATSVYNEVSAGYSARGQGKWISLLGSGIATAINAGTFNSIILGDPFTNNINNYGYAAGQADGVNLPKIRGGYFK